MQKAQRILLLVLPIVFIPFILNFPSGLMIYWLTTNLWTTGQGLVTRRMMPKPDLTRAEADLAHAAEGGAGAEAAQGRRPRPQQAAARRTVARRWSPGPPRRVKRKRSGGGRRR